MNWKTEYQLRDMPVDQRLGLTCKKCGLYQAQTVAELLTAFAPTTYPDEVEAALTCRKWGCKGALRLEVTNDAKLEGFQGGLA